MSDLGQAFELFPILAERAALPAGTLSGGEQQMLAIGRALIARPSLLMLQANERVREIYMGVRP